MPAWPGAPLAMLSLSPDLPVLSSAPTHTWGTQFSIWTCPPDHKLSLGGLGANTLLITSSKAPNEYPAQNECSVTIC